MPTPGGDDVDDDGAAPEVVPREQSGGDAVDLVGRDARRVHERRPVVGRVHREQVALGEDAGGCALGDALQHLADVVAGDELGGGGLQVGQLLAQRRELAVVGATAARPAVPARPGHVVDARRRAVGLALLVDDVRARQPEDLRHRADEPAGVVAVEARRLVALVQLEPDGRGRARRLQDRHRRGRGELRHRARQLPVDLRGGAQGPQEQQQRRRDRRGDEGGTDGEHRPRVAEDLDDGGEQPDADLVADPVRRVLELGERVRHVSDLEHTGDGVVSGPLADVGQDEPRRGAGGLPRHVVRPAHVRMHRTRRGRT